MFLPSANGWHFKNDFLPGPIFMGLGDASAGLCGGMVLGALARFRDGPEIPPDTAAPPPGTDLFRELRGWQLRSVLRGLTGFLSARCRRDPFTWTVEKYLPRLRDDLAEGPVPLVLLWTLSLNPWRMSDNHQVLAYAADEAGISIYDPVWPDDDHVLIEIDTAKREMRHNYYPTEPLLGIYSFGG